MSQSIAVEPQLEITPSQAYRDWLGVSASVLCAIHCAAMPFVVGFLPLLGLHAASSIEAQIVDPLAAHRTNTIVVRALLAVVRVLRDLGLADPTRLDARLEALRRAAHL